jgi:tRNA (cmo5U34)-methyltransferase
MITTAAMDTDQHPPQPTWDEEVSQTFLDYGRYFVPERQAQVQTIAALLLSSQQPVAAIDLCCGDGLLAEAILATQPLYTVWGLDGSTLMLQRAEQRCARFAGRFQPQPFDLFSRQWPVLANPLLAVVSSLAIHHLDGLQKQTLFQEVHARLAVGGVFVIADILQATHPASQALAAETWDAAVRQRALELDGNLEAFARFQDLQWNMFRYFDPEDIDKPSPLFDQLKWLEQAGFAPVEVFWMRAGHAVFGGWK